MRSLFLGSDLGVSRMGVGGLYGWRVALGIRVIGSAGTIGFGDCLVYQKHGCWRVEAKVVVFCSIPGVDRVDCNCRQ